jgi:hypothetical protein
MRESRLQGLEVCLPSHQGCADQREVERRRTRRREGIGEGLAAVVLTEPNPVGQRQCLTVRLEPQLVLEASAVALEALEGRLALAALREEA